MSGVPSKKLLFISRHAPYGSSLAKDALDAILAASAYEQQLGLLFMDDGVFQLLANQNTEQIGQKNFSAILPVLPLYEINSIYVHYESLIKRQITINELVLDSVQIIDSKAVCSLLAQQDQLLSF
ncbi:protein TusC [Cellvibrio zantedeschiae]|uniref:Protein TusC n=1 Tax=Cellvibrio zantedeschiae TaxID=1237077 RepID=A0ABQ3B1E8_9GAMM|nr:sulfurtransferase complex subunit TusC [Cellvibrio zantedeschiae]GGY70499.1 protein TusC [Cellvibrio zantedeschiae]